MKSICLIEGALVGLAIVLLLGPTGGLADQTSGGCDLTIKAQQSAPVAAQVGVALPATEGASLSSLDSATGDKDQQADDNKSQAGSSTGDNSSQATLATSESQEVQAQQAPSTVQLIGNANDNVVTIKSTGSIGSDSSSSDSGKSTSDSVNAADSSDVSATSQSDDNSRSALDILKPVTSDVKMTSSDLTKLINKVVEERVKELVPGLKKVVTKVDKQVVDPVLETTTSTVTPAVNGVNNQLDKLIGARTVSNQPDLKTILLLVDALVQQLRQADLSGAGNGIQLPTTVSVSARSAGGSPQVKGSLTQKSLASKRRSISAGSRFAYRV